MKHLNSLIILIFLTFSAKFSNAQKITASPKVRVDTVIVRDTIWIESPMKEQLVSLKSDFYDEAIKSLDFRKSTIDFLLALTGLMLALIGAITSYNYVTRKEDRRKFEQELLKIEETRERALLLCTEIETKHMSIGNLLVSVEKQVASTISTAEAQAKKLGISEFGEIIKLISEFEAEQSVAKFEVLERLLINQQLPLNTLPAKMLNNVSMNYIRGKNFDKPIEISIRVLERYPNDADANAIIGYSFIQQSKFELGLKYYRVSLKNEPNNWVALAHFAYGALKLYETTLEQGLLQEAKEITERALKIQPKAAIVNYNLSCLYSLEGNKEKMLQFLKIAIQADSKQAEGARKDKDFQAYWNDKEFLEATKEKNKPPPGSA